MAAHVRKHPDEAEVWLEYAFERGRKRRVSMAMATLMLCMAFFSQLLFCLAEH